MRIELKLELIEGLEFPTEYHSLVLSFFKCSLKKYNSELKDILYEERKMKEITFSTFFNLDKFDGEVIKLKNSGIRILFSCYDELLGLHFFNSFLLALNKEFNYKNYKIVLNRVTRIKEKSIEKDEVVFKILSPVAIREKISEEQSRYHMIDDEKGVEILKLNMINSLKKFPEKYIEQLKIEPIQVKKVIVRLYKAKIQCSLGIVRVKGKKEILNYLYKAGLSTSRRGLGFNMVDIIDEEV